MRDQDISDEYLNLFVDNQLDSNEKMQLLDAIKHDDRLKERVCELRRLKEVVLHAYSQPPGFKHSTELHKHPGKYLQALAACLLLLLGGASGWLTHAWTTRENTQEPIAMLQHAQTSETIADTRKIIVLLSNAQPTKLRAALDETEGLLETYKRENRPIQIEVIANKHGVDLLRTAASGYQGRITLMQQRYPNLQFLVCGQTIHKLQAKGEDVKLLPHTGVATSAAEQISKRLQQGWGYIKI